MKGLAAALALALLALSAVDGLAAPQAASRARSRNRRRRRSSRTSTSCRWTSTSSTATAARWRTCAPKTSRWRSTASRGGSRPRSSSRSSAPSTSAPPKPMEYNSNAGAQAGRLVMIAIDSGNIGAGRGKPAIEAARRFVGTLNRADRVALVILPGAGPQIEFTANHAIVQTLLGNVVGQAAENFGQKRVGLAEALAIEREDRIVIDEVIGPRVPGELRAGDPGELPDPARAPRPRPCWRRCSSGRTTRSSPCAISSNGWRRATRRRRSSSSPKG